jgi:hypothetical protein
MTTEPIVATTPTALPPPDSAPTVDPAARVFSRSILISAIRCTLTYVVFPWILPIVGLAPGTGPWIGVIISPIAIGCNVASIRRFWAADHRWKWPITMLNSGVIVLLVILFVVDLGELIG